jgi:hypothetical protein
MAAVDLARAIGKVAERQVMSITTLDMAVAVWRPMEACSLMEVAVGIITTDTKRPRECLTCLPLHPFVDLLSQPPLLS